MAHEVKTDTASFLLSKLDTSFDRHERAFKRCKKEPTEDTVHKLRTSSRKLLALLGAIEQICSNKKPARRLRRLIHARLKCLGSLRDVQVMKDTLELLIGDSSIEESEFFRSLCEDETRLKHKALKSLNKRSLRLRTKRRARLTHQVIQLRMVDASVLSSVLSGILHTAEQEVLQCFKGCNASDTASIHRARVRFKHYRYLCSALERVVPFSPSFDRTQRVQLQTLMGVIQDLDILASKVETSDLKEPLGSLQTALKTALVNRCSEFCAFTQGRNSLAELTAAQPTP